MSLYKRMSALLSGSDVQKESTSPQKSKLPITLVIAAIVAAGAVSFAMGTKGKEDTNKEISIPVNTQSYGNTQSYFQATEVYASDNGAQQHFYNTKQIVNATPFKGEISELFKAYLEDNGENKFNTRIDITRKIHTKVVEIESIIELPMPVDYFNNLTDYKISLKDLDKLILEAETFQDVSNMIPVIRQMGVYELNWNEQKIADLAQNQASQTDSSGQQLSISLDTGGMLPIITGPKALDLDAPENPENSILLPKR